MKKVTVGVAVALALVTSTAFADGVDRRYPPSIAAPAPYVVPPSWTGFYIGAGIGAGSVVTDVTVHDRIADERLFDFTGGDDGVLGTVIVGWDWQVGPNSVLGVFADYDFTDRSTHHRVFDDFFRHSLDHNNVWSVGARLGFLSSPSVLWYATGGYTQVDVDHSARFFDLDGLNISRDRTLDGFFVGGGVDTRLAASNWFLRLEYRFSDFDTGRVRVRDDEGDMDFRVDNDTHAHTARLTLTYKFGSGAYGYGFAPGGWGR
jgi:outer membrane immunogenic protein